MRDLLVIWICKLIYWLLRRLGRHGAALPGLIAERLAPGMLRKLQSLPEGIIVVSGTNGKTTTTHLLAEVLRRSGKRVLTNHSGSNMTRGVLASIVRFSSVTGKLPYDIAVLEIDEAYAAKLAPIIKPRASILTNVLRDQLDRFGEIDHTAKLLSYLAMHTKELVVYNACDSRLEVMSKLKDKKSISYGYSESLAKYFPRDDEWHSVQSRTMPKTAVTLTGANSQSVEITDHATKIQISNKLLPGLHNALNLTAVVACVRALWPDELFDFSDMRPPYGRGEVVVINGKKFTLQLVKNPGGFMTAMGVGANQPALIIINDAIADSRDVSWLWDVSMSMLSMRPSIYTSGTRAYDIANRLKYEDISSKYINTDIKTSITTFVESETSGVLFLTYTAMLEARKILKQLHKRGRP